jgi:hypothetical protein
VLAVVCYPLPLYDLKAATLHSHLDLDTFLVAAIQGHTGERFLSLDYLRRLSRNYSILFLGSTRLLIIGERSYNCLSP